MGTVLILQPTGWAQSISGIGLCMWLAMSVITKKCSNSAKNKYSNGRQEIWKWSELGNPLSWLWTFIKAGCVYSCSSAPAAKELRCTPRILPSPTGAFPAWSRWTQKSLRLTTSSTESTTNCPTVSWCCTCRWRTPPGCSFSGSPLFTLSLGLVARTTPSGTSYSCHPP